ncbi:MAG: transposase [Paracoccaceae bacterium]|jgi:transposase
MSRFGRVSKRGDKMTRTYLFEAANAILTRKIGGSRLRDWARAIAERTGPRKAKVALARKLAGLRLGLLLLTNDPV